MPWQPNILRLNETDKALEYYEDLVNNHPDYVGTYYHLVNYMRPLTANPMR